MIDINGSVYRNSLWYAGSTALSVGVPAFRRLARTTPRKGQCLKWLKRADFGAA